MTTTTTGTVTDIKVRQDGAMDLGFVTILDNVSGQPEIFVLWAGFIGQPTPFSVWIARSLVVGLLREGLANKLNVIVTHDVNSAVVRWVDLLST